MIKKIIKAFPVLILGLFISPIFVFSQTPQGILSFSPSSVKNGQSFDISLSGGPSNTATKIWVDNNDGKGFRDFGDWVTTNASGSISASRTLNCNSYLTLEPGQNIPIGNRKLVQKVYLEYAGLNQISNVATHTKDCTLEPAANPINPEKSPSASGASFPSGETSYTVTTSKGPAKAAFKFGPSITGIIFDQQRLATYLGNKFKNIVWIGSHTGGGPVGRWDISDPWNPRDGGVAGIAYGGSAMAQGTQPAAHRGPFFSGSWPHPPSLGYGGGTLAELANGQARFVFDSGTEGAHPPALPEPRDITPIFSLPPGQGLSLSQLFGRHLFGQSNNNVVQTEHEAHTVIDATASNKFFLYSATSNLVEIYDVTNLTGSVSVGSPTLSPMSSEPWPSITEMEIVQIPGIQNHFLVARSGGGNITEKPVFYIGEIDRSTGRIARQNSFTLDMQGISYTAPYSPGARVFAGSGLKSASVGGKTYVFMNENLTRTSFAASDQGTLKVAAYEFEPQSLTFVRKGDINLENIGTPSDYDFNIARTENGDAYPLLAVTRRHKTPLTITTGAVPFQTPQLYSIDMYGLKEILDSSAPKSLTPALADITMPEDDFVRPISVGQVETAHQRFFIKGRSSSPYHFFLKKEGAKINLYLYRQAFVFDGRALFGSGGPYHTMPATTPQAIEQTAGGPRHSYSPFAGPTALRVDQIDVSGFTGGAFTPATPASPTTPGDGDADAKAILDQPCATTFAGNSALIGLCQQVKFVQKRSCNLVPGLSFCYGFRESQ